MFQKQMPGRLGSRAPSRNENREKGNYAATKTVKSRHKMTIMLTMKLQNTNLTDKNCRLDLDIPT